MKTRPDSDSRVRAWLGRAFMLQLALISIAAVVGVFVASALLGACREERVVVGEGKGASSPVGLCGHPAFCTPGSEWIFEMRDGTAESARDGAHDLELGGRDLVFVSGCSHRQRW